MTRAHFTALAAVSLPVLAACSGGGIAMTDADQHYIDLFNQTTELQANYPGTGSSLTPISQIPVSGTGVALSLIHI